MQARNVLKLYPIKSQNWNCCQVQCMALRLFFSLLHLSVERQEAQSASVKATRRQRLSADSGVMETTNLVTSSKTCLRQSTNYWG